jgi:endonuclease-3 related protein
MPSLADSYPGLVEALTERYGSPAPEADEPDPFAAVLAAFLARSIEPRKARAALAGLRDAGLLDPEALAEADPAEVAEAIKGAGVRLAPKGLRPLQRLARWAADRGADSLREGPTESLREELRAINGVGPSGADAILLSGLGRAVYPVDRASFRILLRHGWLDSSADYEEARDVVEQLAADEPAALARLSAWMERVGVEFCRPGVAKCERCPLRPFLPEGGPREFD